MKLISMFFNTHVRATVSLSGMMRNTVKVEMDAKHQGDAEDALVPLEKNEAQAHGAWEPLLERLSMAPPVLKLYTTTKTSYRGTFVEAFCKLLLQSEVL